MTSSPRSSGSSSGTTCRASRLSGWTLVALVPWVALAACADPLQRTGPEHPAMEEVARLMRGFADGSIPGSQLAAGLGVETSGIDLSREHWSFTAGDLPTADGYRIESFEVRVRQGGFDDAPFVLLYVHDTPCLPFRQFALAAGAHERVEFPSSAHDPASGWVSGYAHESESGGRFLVASGHDEWKCVTLMTAARN